MGGSTINNWGKFNHNVFKGISGVGGEKIAELQRSKNGGVLASRVAEVKESHVHASTVKKFFLGLITFGIYNICHGISAKNQRATQAALKQGVDNVHGALSYLSMMAQRDVQKRGAGGNAKLEQELTDDVREKLEALKTKLDDADNHRPMSMMHCMVAVIKQNLLSALRALGAGSSRTVTENLTNDGVINADNDPAAAPKERRFVTIWP